MSARDINLEKAAHEMVSLSNRKAMINVLNIRGIVVPENATDDVLASLIIKTHPVKSQGDYAAALLNVTHAEGIALTPDRLTVALSAAFPDANIGKRHGPHYLSLARSGKLNGIRDDLSPIPHARRASGEKATSSYDWKTFVTEEKAPNIRSIGDDLMGFNSKKFTCDADVIKAVKNWLEHEDDEDMKLMLMIDLDSLVPAEAAAPAAPAEAAAPAAPAAPAEDAEAPAEDAEAHAETTTSISDLRTELGALSRDNLVARAKLEDVKASGKNNVIIDRIVAKYEA